MDDARRKRSGRPRIRDYVIRVGAAAALLPLLREAGIDPEPLLRDAGLPPRAFDHPDNVVPFAALCRAAHLAAERTGLADAGLRACMRADLKSLGVLGYFAANSETVGHALRALREFLHVHDQGAAVSVREENGVAFLGYEVLDPETVGAEQMTFGALAIAANVLRALCGPRFELSAVTFCYRSPPDAALFRSFFRAPLRFDAERSAVAFDARWLHKPIEGADRYMRELLIPQLMAADAERGRDFDDRIRRVIRTLLASGRCSADAAAGAFGMSRRSLVRRLEDAGSSFRGVVDEARFDAARSLLASSRVEIDEVAATLGYADTSTFARAFRRWSGVSPALWRQRHRRP